MFRLTMSAVLALIVLSSPGLLCAAQQDEVPMTTYGASPTKEKGVYRVIPAYEKVTAVAVSRTSPSTGKNELRWLDSKEWTFDRKTGRLTVKAALEKGVEVTVTGPLARPRGWIFGDDLDPRNIEVVINDRTLAEGKGYKVDRKRGIITVTDPAAAESDMRFFVRTGSKCIANYAPNRDGKRPVIGIGAAPGKRGSGKPQPGTAGPVKAGSGSSSISGRVVNSKGKPVRGARIRVRCSETGLRQTYKTDESGRYSVEGLSAGFYSIVLEKGRTWNSRHKMKKVEKGEAAVIDFVPLADAAALCGEVLDTRGRPIVKCYLSINNLAYHAATGHEYAQDHAWTDSTGFFSFDNLPPTKFDVTIRCQGIVCMSPGGTFELEKGVEREVTIKVHPGEVAGTVEVEGGKPEGSRPVHLLIRKERGGRGQHWNAYAEKDGSFVVQNLPRGTYTATAHLAGFYSEPVVFKSTGKKRKKGRKLELTLLKAGSLLVRVFDGEGKPVENVDISELLSSSSSRTVHMERVEAGVFRVHSLGPGRKRFRFHSSERGHADATVEIRAAEETEVEVTI